MNERIEQILKEMDRYMPSGAMFGGVAEEFYGKTGLKNEKILAHYLDPFLFGILVQRKRTEKD